MEYGKYDETARYFRRMDELAEQLAAADPEALEPQKVKASVKAILGDFQMYRIGDAKAALKFFDQALALRRQWLAREPSNDEAKRGVANILGAIARVRLLLGEPAKARDNYREELALRDQFSPDLANQLEVRRERAGLIRKARRPEHLSWRAKGRPRVLSAGARSPQGNRRAEPRRDPGPARRADLALEKVAKHELIYSREPKIARQHYQEALDGFLERLKAEPESELAKTGRRETCNTTSPRPTFARGTAIRRWPIIARAATFAKSSPRTRKPSPARWT